MNNVSERRVPSLIAASMRRKHAEQHTAVVPADTTYLVREQFKILVADDSRIYRSLVEKVLAPEGYTLVFAENGYEALQAMANHQPSLLISDWEMPDITGPELCRKIR